MPIRCVILDFDGTFTDVEREAEPFTRAFPQLVEDLVGAERMAGRWAQAVADVRAQPHLYGWMYDGKVVAPGDADPYVLATAAVNRVFDGLGVLRDPKLRSGVAHLLYQQAYQHTQSVFRPHAAEVLRELLGRGMPVFVVSNSDTAAVRRKIESLGVPVSAAGSRSSGQLQVFGDARKFAVDELSVPDAAFSALPVASDIGGPRQILVRRGPYYRVLQEIWAQTGTTPASTLVCGDIYELDLGMPQALGCEVHLICRATTSAIERRYVGEQRSSDDLRSLLARVA